MTHEVIDADPRGRFTAPGTERHWAVVRNRGVFAMISINEAVSNYIAAWNETDAGRRRGIVARTWSDDGRYLDAHREGTGHAAIDAMIAAVQERFAGHRFRLASGIEAHHDRVRFSWTAGGTDQAPLFFGGTDFAVLAEDGRLRMVTGFTDAAPSAA